MTLLLYVLHFYLFKVILGVLWKTYHKVILQIFSSSFNYTFPSTTLNTEVGTPEDANPCKQYDVLGKKWNTWGRACKHAGLSGHYDTKAPRLIDESKHSFPFAHYLLTRLIVGKEFNNLESLWGKPCQSGRTLINWEKPSSTSEVQEGIFCPKFDLLYWSFSMHFWRYFREIFH